MLHDDTTAEPSVRKAPRPEPPGGYLPELDGLRGMAVGLVWLYHAALVSPALARYVMPGALDLRAGVELFFVLSGFLIYTPFVRSHLAGNEVLPVLAYVRRRIARIYPAYLVAFGGLLALGWISYRDTSNLVANLTLTQEYQPSTLGGTGLLPAWTLCVEVSFYAFVPLWAAVVRRTGRGRDRARTEIAGAVGLMAVGVVALWFDVVYALPRPLSVLVPELPTLAGGMLLAVVVAARPERPRLDRLARRVPPPAVCWTVAFAALLWMPGQPDTWRSTDRVPLMVAALTKAAFGLLVAAPLMLGVASDRPVARALRSRPLVGVGLISYGIYLWHFDILRQLRPGHLDRSPLQAVAVLVILLAVSVAAGALSHRLVERPALAWGRRRRVSSVAAPTTPS